MSIPYNDEVAPRISPLPLLFSSISNNQNKLDAFRYLLYILGYASAIAIIALDDPNCQKFFAPSESSYKYMPAVNLGGIIDTGAFLCISQIIVDEKYRYLYSCIVATSSVVVAAVLIIIGYRYYLGTTTHETVVTSCIPAVISAFQSWPKYDQEAPSQRNEDADYNPSTLLNPSNSLSEEDRSRRLEHRSSTFPDFAKLPLGKFHERIVDEVKSLRGLIIVFDLLIPYWLIYDQLSSTFRLQAQYMEGANNYTLTYVWPGDPAAVIDKFLRRQTLFYTGVSIRMIGGILLFNIFAYKFLDFRYQAPTSTTKFVIGMCLACLAMCIAGSVEVYRQEGCESPVGTEQRNCLL